ncbi:MAG: hypothetical protein FWG93_08220, partial [Oscillospiraceae bacterium]|nr:hypothetical protein [Oscillospiraceae bacterium]
SRTYMLRPGATYHFEYEYAAAGNQDAGVPGTGGAENEGGGQSGTENGGDGAGSTENGDTENSGAAGQNAPAVRLTADFHTRPSGEDFLDDRYYVEAVHFDSFKDSVRNQFFTHKGTARKDGRIGLFDVRASSATATTTFVVPEGKKALLSFDYNIYQAREIGWRNGVSINGDGRFFEKTANPHTANVTHSGRYTHPFLLNEGINTLTYQAYHYIAYEAPYGHVGIENLKVSILSETAAAAAPTYGEEKGADGWIAAKGSFTAPHEVPFYGGKEMEYLPSVQLPRRPANRANTEYYTLTVEPGYLSKTFGYPTVSVGGMATTSANIRSNGRLFQLSPPDRGNTPLGRVSSGSRIYMGDFSGTTEYRVTHSPNESAGYRVTLNLNRVEQFIYKNTAEAAAGRVFFNAGRDRAFEAAEAFDGAATLSFEIPGGDTLLRNFQVYYMDGGRRVYLTEIDGESLTEMTEWQKEGVEAEVVSAPRRMETDEREIKIYQKGQLVSYGVTYYDHESDPSKKQYWRYTHTPMNDGPHPEAGLILNEAIDRFYIDGKYVVEHWQEDDTSRGTVPGGNPAYDKESNVAEITFYVVGAVKAPYITSIAESPKPLKEGQLFQIRTGIDDEDKRVLSLTTEVYRERRLLYTHTQTNIHPNASGVYPYVFTDTLPDPAKVGAYEVVGTVRSEVGAGLGSYRFVVTADAKITGWVRHTEQWEQNRQNYNVKNGHGSFNKVQTLNAYMQEARPRPRGSNVFWPGERFVLEAAVGGEPERVTARIEGYAAYTTTLRNTGRKNAEDETIFDGALWAADMARRWGRNAPEQLTFIFTAQYEDMAKDYEVKVIMDQQDEYWLLHRVQ